MESSARDRLVARFAAYLDGAEALDDAAEGQLGPDLFTLLAELAALKTEVKLESRQVKGALDQFRDALDLVRLAQTQASDAQAQRAEAARRVQAGAERDLLLELLDLRDRLQAGHDQARRYNPGWLARRGGAGDYVAAMAEGMALNLKRLDDTLARRSVRPLRVLGRRFDPQTMNAADVDRDPGQADGLVLAEVRTGFLQSQCLLRAAEVVVNRLDRAAGD
jgi:molecular chaperone GrpE